MSKPTQAQIEAAKKVLNTRDRFPAWTSWHDEWLIAALTAAAQVGEQGPHVTWETMDKLDAKFDALEAATIERCAQVAEDHWIPGPYNTIPQDIAAAIRRKLKDKP